MCLTIFTLKTYTKFCLNLSNSYGDETCRETETIRQLYLSVTRFLQKTHKKCYMKGAVR